MPRKAPLPLFELIDRFMDDPKPGHIMFCRRFHVHNEWDIYPGAVLEISEAQPGLIDICRGLYKSDKDWFIGDIDALFDERIKFQ